MGRKLRTAIIANLVAGLLVAPLFAVAASKTKRCAALLQPEMSASSRSYISLMKRLVERGALTADKIQELASSDQPANPFEGNDLGLGAVEAHAYRLGFARLLLATDFNWKQIGERFSSLKEKTQERAVQRTKASDKARSIFAVKKLAHTDLSPQHKWYDYIQDLRRDAFQVHKTVDGKQYVSFGEANMSAGNLNGSNEQHTVDLQNGTVNAVPFKGLEPLNSFLAHDGHTLASYALEDAVVVFDVETGKPKWKIPYRKIDKTWPRFSDLEGNEAYAGFRVKTMLYLDSDEKPQLYVGWSSRKLKAGARVDLESKKVTELAGGQRPKIYRTRDQKRVVAAWAENVDGQPVVFAYDVASGKMLVQKPVGFRSGDRCAEGDIAFYEAADGRLSVLFSLTDHIYVENLSDGTDSLVRVSSERLRPSLIGAFTDKAGVQVAWGSYEGFYVYSRRLDIEKSGHADARGARVVTTSAGSYLVAPDDNAKGLQIIALDRPDMPVQKLQMPPGFIDLIDAYTPSKGDGSLDGDDRVEAIILVKKAFVKIQIFGPARSR